MKKKVILITSTLFIGVGFAANLALATDKNKEALTLEEGIVSYEEAFPKSDITSIELNTHLGKTY